VPLADQIVLELKHFEGCSGSEIAEALGIPEGTVRGRLSRGLERLRERVRVRIRMGSMASGRPSVDDIEEWAAQLRAVRGAPT
jgi:RNA polymerase sigma-70 factor (ECF subfamily)